MKCPELMTTLEPGTVGVQNCCKSCEGKRQTYFPVYWLSCDLQKLISDTTTKKDWSNADKICRNLLQHDEKRH